MKIAEMQNATILENYDEETASNGAFATRM